MSAGELLAELHARGVVLQAHGERLAYDAPAGAMTPELRNRMKACKSELLVMLAPKPEAPVQLASHADWEWRRFLGACQLWPDRRGWYDPAERGFIDTLTRAAEPPPASLVTGRQPDLYEVDGRMMTFVERAEHYRATWRASGYPPGVQPRDGEYADK